MKLVKFFLLTAAFLMLMPSMPGAQAGITVLKTASVSGMQGLPKRSTLDVTVKNGADLSGTVPGGQNTLSLAPYLQVNFSCTLDGFQALIISTDNSNATANPKYTGGGSGSGLILTTNTATNAALHWVVFPTPVVGGYTFVPGPDPNAEPIQTSNQFFVADKKESPFPAGYASTVYNLDNYTGDLPAAPTGGRNTTTGTAYIYLGANVKGMPAGTYKTSMLSVELVTINGDNTITVHQKRTFTVTVTK